MSKFLLALSLIEGLGPATIKKLVAIFDSPEAVFKASKSEFLNKGLSDKLANLIINQRDKIEIEKYIKQLNSEDIKMVSYLDDDYPGLLKQIYDPPIVLYYRGNLKITSRNNLLAVVGSRKISAYAKKIMPQIIEPLKDHNFVIISGLAYGVDSLAHQLAIDYKLPTIAITGSSLAWPDLYPRGNFELAKNIVNQGGLLLSEFPPDYKIGRFNFPRRNRIISGLSRAVLIIEAARKSGALITADFALEQNREILVLPQNLDGLNSAGSNNLIKNGGQIITSTEDILAGFDIFYL